MKHQDAADAYRRSAVENAPPVKIVRMLYAGALRFLDQALAEDAGDPGSQFIELVERVDRIVIELRLALDPSQGEEVAEKLNQLYLFVEDGLARAAAERSHAALHEVRPVLQTLADAWNRVDLSQAQVA